MGVYGYKRCIYKKVRQNTDRECNTCKCRVNVVLLWLDCYPNQSDICTQKKKMETGKKIKELRIKKGMTQEELAELTELSARTIQRIEKGEVDPRSYTLQMIAKALEVDYSLFVEVESIEDKERKAKEDRFLLGLVHLSGLVPLFIPTILIWKNLKNRVEGITIHFYEVISFQITILLVFILPGLLIYYFVQIQNFINKPYLVFLGIILGVIISIHNTINVINNKPYTRFNIFTFKKKDEKDSK